MGVMKLSRDLGRTIVASLDPFSVKRFHSAWCNIGSRFSSTCKARYEAKASATVWSLIFKNNTWIDKLREIDTNGTPTLFPLLLSRDLHELYDNRNNNVYAIMLINDIWTGDSKYLENEFFNSLQDHEFDRHTSTVNFRSGLKLHVGDCVNSKPFVTMDDITKLFRRRNKGLSTTVLYHWDHALQNIDPNCIRGVQEFSSKRMKCIQDVCSVRLQFGNGKPVHTLFEKTDSTLPVHPIHVKYDDGMKWAAGWRLARPDGYQSI